MYNWCKAYNYMINCFQQHYSCLHARFTWCSDCSLISVKPAEAQSETPPATCNLFFQKELNTVRHWWMVTYTGRMLQWLTANFTEALASARCSWWMVTYSSDSSVTLHSKLHWHTSLLVDGGAVKGNFMMNYFVGSCKHISLAVIIVKS